MGKPSVDFVCRAQAGRAESPQCLPGAYRVAREGGRLEQATLSESQAFRVPYSC